jgi:hypothetical protein
MCRKRVYASPISPAHTGHGREQMVTVTQTSRSGQSITWTAPTVHEAAEHIRTLIPVPAYMGDEDCLIEFSRYLQSLLVTGGERDWFTC